MVHRSGGRPGDALYVSGTIGAGAAGLALLKGEAGPWDGLPARRARRADPALPRAGAAGRACAGARRIRFGRNGRFRWPGRRLRQACAASGCSAVIEAENVPLPPGLASGDDPELLARLLTAGDDFEILAAVAPEKEMRFRQAAERAGVPVARIGALTAGPGRRA